MALAETSARQRSLKRSRPATLGHPWPLSAAGFLLLTLLARGSSLRAPLGEDAATYLYVGHTIFHGGTPYVDAVETKGPATQVLYGLVDFVSSGHVVIVRLILACAAALTALLLARWVARSAGVRTGLIAGAVLATLGAAIALDGLDPNTEQFGVMFMVGAVLLASSGTVPAAVGAGALSGWAVLMNPGFVTIVLLAAFELGRSTRGDGRRAVLRAGAAYAGGIVAVALPFAVWLGAAGALDDMKAQVWDYSRTAAGAHLLINAPATHMTDLHFLLNLPAGGLWIAGAVGALVAIGLGGRARNIGVSALLWILLAWLRGKANHGFEYSHHYYLAMPGIAAGIGAGIGALLDVVPRRAGFALAAMIVAAPLWSFVVGPQWRDWNRPVNVRADAVRFSTAYPIAAVIRRETPAGSPIFVAGSEAEIYWLAGRRAPTRWFANYLLFADRSFGGERERQLRANPPAAIALMTPETITDVDDGVQRLIDDLHYRVAWQTAGGTVWVRPDL